MSVPNLKRIAFFVQKLLGGPNFTPPQTPFPGAQNRQNLNSWRRSLPAPTDPVWWRSMHAISSYRGNRHRPPTTNTQTHRQDRLQYIAPLASAQCNNRDIDRRKTTLTLYIYSRYTRKSSVYVLTKYYPFHKWHQIKSSTGSMFRVPQWGLFHTWGHRPLRPNAIHK